MEPPHHPRRLASTMSLPVRILALGLLLGFAGEVQGQCLANERAKLSAANAVGNEQFGQSIAVNGDVLVVGAPWAGASLYGAAYVYRFDGMTWPEEACLTAPDPADGDVFGNSVSVTGNVALIAMMGDDDGGVNAGSVFVYRFDETVWIEEARLFASDAAPLDGFGTSVAVSGEVAVVGAMGRDDGGTDAGAAYVFRFDGKVWNEQARLTAADAAPGDNFGRDVALRGDVAVIGAQLDDDSGLGSGAAYVFRFDGTDWVQEAKLVASDAAASDNFGAAVAVSGDVAVIGSVGDDVGALNTGSAYVFRFDGSSWVEEAKLFASDAALADGFGTAVGVDGGVAVIGASLDDLGALNTGSAYLYRHDGTHWVEEAWLAASDGATGDNFGLAVSISGDVAAIGAREDDDAAPHSGAAYVFGGVSSDCNGNADIDLCDIAGGSSPDANCNGVPDECDCPGDVDGDGFVGVIDLLDLLAAWGPCPGCSGDVDCDGSIGVIDLLAVLGAWGACPKPEPQA